MKSVTFPCNCRIVQVVALVCWFAAVGAAAPEIGDTAILKQTSRAFSHVARKAIPAVVFIKVEKAVPSRSAKYPSPYDDYDAPGEDLYDFLFRGPQDRGAYQQQFRMLGQGTGFLISPDGYILTNHHIVSDANRIVVKLHDGREFEATFVGSDARSEIAVIRIQGKDFPFLPLGNSDALEIGEWVIAIGNPFGLSETLTVGVVSAKGRNNIGITDYEDFIQTDAAINPGNSGGPLLNTDGQAIGINTAIFSQTGGSLGIGFAIPITMAVAIKDQLIKSGKVTRGYLGVALQDLNHELAESFGLARSQGALVAEVVKGSAADAAGLNPGDVITELGGKPVENASAVRNQIATTAPKTTLKLKILRKSAVLEKTVIVGVQTASGAPDEAAALSGDKLGIAVEDLTEEWIRRFGYEPNSGVIVTRVQAGSPAHHIGIQPGNLIGNVNQQPVRTAKEFQAQLAKAMQTGTVLLLIRDPAGSRFMVLRVK